MTELATSTPATYAVECRALVKRYPDVVAVDGLDLVVHPGECLGVLGPNGAGKTTTVEMIEGLTAPTSGSIALFGRTWGESAAGDRIIRGTLGVQLQESHFQERLTVAETIDLFASFYGDARPTSELVALVGLEQKADARVGKLSGGQRQRLALACALVGRPRLLCLDEPSTGLDPQSRRQIWDIVAHFKAGGGTILLTTHYMEEAAQLSDRVAIMNSGKIIALDTPHALIASLGAEDIVVYTSERPLDPAMLAALPGVGSVRLDGETGRLSSRSVAETLPALFAAATQAGTRILTLATHQATLEDVFVHHTGRGLE
ncbi:MAG: ABC transporter ATP-binding protein [Myxococcota bacterium]